MARANRWRVYINPFDDLGVYTGYVEVTSDVTFDDVGAIAQQLDNTDFNLGVYRNSNFNVTFRNDRGTYSDVGNPQSIFHYTRANSLIKITWETETTNNLAGWMIAGQTWLSTETTVFVGLLNDDSLTMDLTDQAVQFTCMGRESVLGQMTVPSAALVGTPNISDIIKACLNQTALTDILTYSAANINVGTDAVVDTPVGYATKTVLETLDDLLLASNSVLYISGDTVFVSARIPTADVKATFYGQASKLGIENVQDILNIKSGTSRTFNFLTWQSNTTPVQNLFSVNKYGAKKFEFSIDSITNATVQAALMAAVLTEFGLPKQELDLIIPLSYSSLGLNLLDRVSIDYPTVYLPGDFALPILGVAILGSAVLPNALWAFTIDPTTSPYKIIGKSLDPQNALMTLNLRLI